MGNTAAQQHERKQINRTHRDRPLAAECMNKKQIQQHRNGQNKADAADQTVDQFLHKAQ